MELFIASTALLTGIILRMIYLYRGSVMKSYVISANYHTTIQDYLSNKKMILKSF